MSLTAFIAFAALCLFAAISPGPAVLMSARTGLTQGFRTGLGLAAGIGTGAVVWALAAIFGLGVVFAVAPALLWALKILGGAYLVWMGWHLWRDAAKPFSTADNRSLPQTPIAGFRLGLLTQFSNPKAAVMFSAIFLGTVPPHTPYWQIAALLLVIFINEFLWNALVSRIFSLDRTRAAYISLKTIIDRAFGGLLIALGVKVAAT